MNALKSIVVGFIAGAIAAVTVQEFISWLFVQYWTGWSEIPWSTEPVREFGRSGCRSAVDRKYRGNRWPLGRSFRLDTRVEAARHDDHPRRYPRLDRPRSDRGIFNRAVSGSQVVASARWQRQRDRADTLHRSRFRGRCGLALRSVQLRASAVSLSRRTVDLAMPRPPALWQSGAGVPMCRSVCP